MKYSRTLVLLAGMLALIGHPGTTFAGSSGEKIEKARALHRAEARKFMAEIQAQQEEVCPYSKHETACVIEYRLASKLVLDVRVAADLAVISKIVGEFELAEIFRAEHDRAYKDLTAELSMLRRIHTGQQAALPR